MARPILILSGTNRPDSNALRVSHVLRELYEKHTTPAEVFSLCDLPPEMFSPSAYADKPPKVKEIQQRVLDAAGLHVVTPEYNGGYPGALKYLIDMLKFPESFDHKPVAFVGEANGTTGAMRAVEQLQGVFAYRNAHQYPKRVFMPAIKSRFDASGKFVDAELLTRLEEQCVGFAKFAAAVGG